MCRSLLEAILFAGVQLESRVGLIKGLANLSFSIINYISLICATWCVRRDRLLIEFNSIPWLDVVDEF